MVNAFLSGIQVELRLRLHLRDTLSMIMEFNVKLREGSAKRIRSV